MGFSQLSIYLVGVSIHGSWEKNFINYANQE